MQTVAEVKKREIITVPEAVRKALDIKEGSIISFDITEVINMKKEPRED